MQTQGTGSCCTQGENGGHFGASACIPSPDPPSGTQGGPCWAQGMCGRQQCSQTILRLTPNSCMQPQRTSQELGCQWNSTFDVTVRHSDILSVLQGAPHFLLDVELRDVDLLADAPLDIHQYHWPPSSVQVPAHVQPLGALCPCMTARAASCKGHMPRRLQAANSTGGLLQACTWPASTTLGCPAYCHDRSCTLEGPSIPLQSLPVSKCSAKAAPLTMAVPRTGVVLQPRAAMARPLICLVSRCCST